jgi:hypothetical protein
MEKIATAETILAKQAFELFAKGYGVPILHYHCDNGRFADNAFVQHVADKHQTISYCGVNAHHQNGKAERRIRDVTEAARTSLLHATHRWPQAVSNVMWPQALKHAINSRNQTPRSLGAPSPLARFTSLPFTLRLSDQHPFGCPVYVLTAPLQAQ